MDEVGGASFAKVQAAFHRTYPKSTVRFDIHGIHGVRRERTGIVGVNGVAQKQALWSQADNASRLSAYPDVAVIDTDTIHELAFHRYRALRCPCGKAVCLVVVDVYTSQ